jgi:hypothetical protein
MGVAEDLTGQTLASSSDPAQGPCWLAAKGAVRGSAYRAMAETKESLIPGPLSRLLAEDHTRLDGLLQCAVADAGAINHAAYAAFRAGLLRHIGMEEKVLLPAAQQWRGGVPLPIAAQRRRDHGALAALLVPTLTPAIIAATRTILTAHNALEEGPGGLYEMCEPLAGAEAEELLAQLQATPEVPVAPYADGPHVMNVVRRALARAGYDLDLDERTWGA